MYQTAELLVQLRCNGIGNQAITREQQTGRVMKHDVFISYKRQSLNIVNAIAHILENEDIRCWFDSGLDEKAGKDYLDIIAENITESRIVIAVLSNEALESDWIKSEITTALDQKKHVIPFVISELTISNGLTMRLSNKHRIDAYPNPDRKFAILLKSVKLALNEYHDIENDDPQKDQRFKFEEEDFSIDFDFDEGEALYEAEEYYEAALAYLASAERGNQKAKDKLCQLFYDKHDKICAFDEDIWNAIELQARNGHCYANFLMHCKLYKEAAKNLVAFEYLKNAIKKNSIPLAFLRMGIQYSWGMGVKQSHTLGNHYYNKALSMGCKEAYSYIAQEFRWGNDKKKKNTEKAIELLKKGIAAKDKRSYYILFNIYLYDLKQIDKAKAIAMQAIDSGDDKGYSLMGDLEYTDQNVDSAIKWYKIALKHDVAGAYGKLAIIYDGRDEKDTALTMAKKGIMVQDSLSYHFLGSHYTKKNELDKAWKYFKECFDQFGYAADELATLVIEHGYTPPEITTEEEKRIFLDQLEQIVEIQARNNNENCIIALLKIYSYKENGKYILDSDIWKKNAKAFEIIRLGAEFGSPEMMYDLGMALMDDQTPNKYNPSQGLMWLENAAESGYPPSLRKLLELYSTGIWEDEKEFQKILMIAIKHKPLSYDKLLSYLRRISIDKIGQNDKDIIYDFIKKLILGHVEESDKYKAIGYYIKNKEFLQQQPDETLTNEIKNLADMILTERKYGYLRQERSIILEYYPEYNRAEGIKDFMNNKESVNAQIFYAFDNGCHTEYEHEAKLHDNALEIIFGKLRNDASFAEFAKAGETERLGVDKDWLRALDDFDNAYQILCTSHDITPYEHIFPGYEESIPYISSNTAIKVWHNVLHCMYTLYDHIPVIKDIIDKPIQHEEILNIAEGISNDTDLQLLLIVFVEIALIIEDILSSNHTTWEQLEDEEYEYVAERINQYIDLVNKCDIKDKLEKYTAETISQLYKKRELHDDKPELDNEFENF